jgi:hypothetical protein
MVFRLLTSVKSLWLNLNFQGKGAEQKCTSWYKNEIELFKREMSTKINYLHKFTRNKIVLFAIYINWRGNKKAIKLTIFFCQFCYTGIVLAEGLEIRLRKLRVLRNTMWEWKYFGRTRKNQTARHVLQYFRKFEWRNWWQAQKMC